MPKSFFKKSLVFNPITLKDGVVPFQRVGRHDGILETENEATISALTKLVTENRLGVSVITEEEYELLKKNPPVNLSPQRFPVASPPMEAPLLPQPQARAAAASRATRTASKPSTAKGVLAP